MRSIPGIVGSTYCRTLSLIQLAPIFYSIVIFSNSSHPLFTNPKIKYVLIYPAFAVGDTSSLLNSHTRTIKLLEFAVAFPQISETNFKTPRFYKP